MAGDLRETLLIITGRTCDDLKSDSNRHIYGAVCSVFNVDHNGKVMLAQNFCHFVKNLDSLIEKVFSSLQNRGKFF